MPPALKFDSLADDPELDQARDALAAYARARALLDHQRDAIVAGALAAGVSAAEIQRTTAVARTTAAAIAQRAQAAGSTVAATASPPKLELVAVLRHRAGRRAHSTDHTDAGYVAACQFAANSLEAGLSPEVTMVPTEDAELLTMAAAYRYDIERDAGYAGEPREARARRAGQMEAMRQIVADLDAIRALGDAWPQTLPEDEQQALAENAAQVSLHLKATATGRTVAEVAQMSQEEFLAALGPDDHDTDDGYGSTAQDLKERA
ncbi:hypothetical protein BIV57_00485 [Mangrovactinospora gilvigrisea]|uniref:Uncharacterized protein n=1 Tax=Mangrovactinospora gilvigrisea TaxID=1428644 RepID=A0A1J7BL31_9ACTN|nr:hypothetical protein BIV57_00485 [Mangrovactinospora gilvigrisea]